MSKEKLNEEKLNKVSGGTSHSGSTYKELGIESFFANQNENNHPVIVSLFNYCKYGHDNYCFQCSSCEYIFPTCYCKKRSLENDPCNGGWIE